ncbi:MAG TPA: flagellar hook-basal body protein [Candidatus Baltobacteraceae bacterium]|nr:flagellar hook-basal body protein [Candidatus Baltobacteraceae bacterium]
MIQALYTAASGMASNQTRLDVLANNLANVGTTGFKQDLVAIDTTQLANAVQGEGEYALTMSTVHAGRSGIDMTPGSIRSTGNLMDLAIEGPGLIVVSTPDGERYTRGGSFVRDANGYLTTDAGFQVMGQSGPIRVPETGLVIDGTGRLADGQALRFVSDAEPSRLVKAGGNLYAPADETTPPDAVNDVAIAQGQIENSNVNVVRTMVEMLCTLRSYEAYQRTIQALDQTNGQASTDLGRV